ncbi:hypothetical protein AVEN_163920-1 [Araneus ventricosus]|uniref:Uncharacterized protein n=1 Tax=Araneus ventricosus TaxID=182803 RepID=A0A4Y2KD04_ARAVE|nr:hypothetical protein AVEN_163920-1 [Araneus ventricosus]
MKPGRQASPFLKRQVFAVKFSGNPRLPAPKNNILYVLNFSCITVTLVTSLSMEPLEIFLKITMPIEELSHFKMEKEERISSLVSRWNLLKYSSKLPPIEELSHFKIAKKKEFSLVSRWNL